MRTPVVFSLLLVAACGAAQKPAESEDTSPAESKESASTEASDHASAPSAAGGGAAAAAPNDATEKPSDKPSDGTASASASGPAAPATGASNAVHPLPSTSGSIDGKPFAPKLAQVAGKLQKDGRLLVALTETTDCVSATDAKPGDAMLTMVVPWQSGMKADLAALPRPKGKSKGEIAFTRVNDKKKSEVSKTFRPSGTVTIVSAPTEQNAFGKMKIDLSSGDYILAGDLDVKVCSAVK